MRKIFLAGAAAAIVVTSGGVAFAEEIPLPRVGRWGCEVNGGTVGVAEPDGLVTYNGFYVNPTSVSRLRKRDRFGPSRTIVREGPNARNS